MEADHEQHGDRAQAIQSGPLHVSIGHWPKVQAAIRNSETCRAFGAAPWQGWSLRLERGYRADVPALTKRASNRIRRSLRSRGFDVVRYRPGLPEYIDEDAATTIDAVAPFTMTNSDSLFSLIQSVRYVIDRDIEGAFVECGVWRGGSVMAVALTLLQRGIADRELYLFDTFEGMTEPTGVDVLIHAADHTSAASMLAATEVGDGANVWCRSPLEEVQAALRSTGYPMERIHYIKGPVEQTLPGQSPDGSVALLRLDTDWYESTQQELRHLVPAMPDGGVLIIDDYWHWGGCRQAVDEYLAVSAMQILLTRVDITAVGTVHRHPAPRTSPR
jgi:O-methyltransferase